MIFGIQLRKRDSILRNRKRKTPLAGRVRGKTDAVVTHIVDDVLVLDGNISKNSSHSIATSSDTPAVGITVLSGRDDVVVGVDGEGAPARNLGSEDGESLDLKIRHGVAVSVEDRLTRLRIADTREISAGAQRLDTVDESVVGTSGEDQEGSSRVDDGVGIIAGRVSQRLSIDSEVIDLNDEPLLLDDGSPLGGGGSVVAESQGTAVGAEAHRVDGGNLLLLNHAEERRDSSPGRESSIAQTEDTIDTSGPKSVERGANGFSPK